MFRLTCSRFMSRLFLARLQCSVHLQPCRCLLQFPNWSTLFVTSKFYGDHLTHTSHIPLKIPVVNSTTDGQLRNHQWKIYGKIYFKGARTKQDSFSLHLEWAHFLRELRWWVVTKNILIWFYHIWKFVCFRKSPFHIVKLCLQLLFGL